MLKFAHKLFYECILWIKTENQAKISDFKEMNICVAVEEIVLHLVRFLRLCSVQSGSTRREGTDLHTYHKLSRRNT